MDGRVGQDEAQGGLAERLARALEESELLDALEAQLELIALRSTPVLFRRDRLARP